jgi:PKD repeat protein
VTYSTAGTYNIGLTVTNSAGSATKTSTALINVLSLQPDFTGWRYEDSFEVNQDFSNYWTVNNPGGGRQWELTTDAAYTGNQSVYLYNFINVNSGISDELISPSYDLSAIITPRLYFKVAYARKSASTSDNLRIHYSFNCGESWSILSVKNATALESVSGYYTQKFVPADKSQWKEIAVNLSSFVASKNNVKFKFEFISGIGNNIYIDDINISSTTGINEEDPSAGLLVYPNPVRDLLTIDFTNAVIRPGQIEIRDLSGRTVYERSQDREESNGSSVQIDVANLSPGIYFLNVKGENGGNATKKIAVR